jgi:AcrR family transcriptional regulator
MQKNPELTRQKIVDAFLTLYEKKPIEKISIGELTQEAGVYRGTFYYYYEDIYDLLSQIEAEFLDLNLEIVSHIIDGIFTGNIESEVPFLFPYYQKNERQIRIFLIERPNQTILHRMKEAGKQLALSRLGLDINHLSLRASYIAEYIASAQLGLVTMWLERGQELSPSEVADLMQSINLTGAITCLIKENTSFQ